MSEQIARSIGSHAPSGREYLRLTIPQRVEHWAYAISFAVLTVTGIPQKFAGSGWAETMIALMGGVELVRVLHHTAAIVMVLAAIYHVIVLAYKVFVLRVRWTMFPRLDDAIDGIDAIRYNLGLTSEHPKFDRYNFSEKMEYWAGAWGTVVMVITGFIMWNPITFARLMPGDLIPASKAAHGAEAILAAGAILIWHFYNVHIKTLNKAVFTGSMTEHQMQEEHALELERIKSGKVDRRPPNEVIKRRERTYIPLATFFAVLMLVALFFATSYESTAITTLPRRQPVQVYAPITPTPYSPTGIPVSVASAKPLPASHEGRTTCLGCHQTLTKPAMPTDHASRADTSCTACHKVGTGGAAAATPQSTALPVDTTKGGQATPVATSATSTSGGVKPLPADHEGRTTCLACHQALPKPAYPADHAGRTDTTCTGCHKVGTSGTAATPQATAGPTSASTTSGGPKPLPASHEGRTTCNACHANGLGPANPADHAGRQDATCVACHKTP